MANAARDKAVRLLDHYLCMIAERSGMKVDSDTHAEIAEVVDSIIEATIEENRKYMTGLVVTGAIKIITRKLRSLSAVLQNRRS